MVNKIDHYIKIWEGRCYKQGIPDEAPKELDRLDLVPSYKRICLAILKNDNALKSLGYTGNYSKYYSDLKRIELSKRKGFVIQLKLNL